MKREYVRPMIEIETFVANEYVAACWTVKCISGHNKSFVYKGDTEPNSSMREFRYSSSGNSLAYTGNALGSPNWDEFWTHGGDHLVSVTPVDGHPNASI